MGPSMSVYLPISHFSWEVDNSRYPRSLLEHIVATMWTEVICQHIDARVHTGVIVALHCCEQ
jgi:hypothetical protein